MSFFSAPDPSAGDQRACDAIAQVIVPRTSDLGGFQVRRALALGAAPHGRPVHFS